MRANSRMCKAYKRCRLCIAGDVGSDHWKRLFRPRAQDIICIRGRYDMPIKKPQPTQATGGVPGGARTGDDWVLYPTLMEFLSEDRYDDGSPRRTATVTLFADAGTVKGSLNDRDLDRVAFVSAESLAALLVILEAKLSESSLDWRDNQGKGRGKGRK